MGPPLFRAPTAIPANKAGLPRLAAGNPIAGPLRPALFKVSFGGRLSGRPGELLRLPSLGPPLFRAPTAIPANKAGLPRLAAGNPIAGPLRPALFKVSFGGRLSGRPVERPDRWIGRSKGAQGLTVGPYRSTYSRILQFHRDQASDSREVVTPFMQDGTYPTRNFATLGPFLTAAVNILLIRGSFMRASYFVMTVRPEGPESKGWSPLALTL